MLPTDGQPNIYKSARTAIAVPARCQSAAHMEATPARRSICEKRICNGLPKMVSVGGGDYERLSSSNGRGPARKACRAISHTSCRQSTGELIESLGDAEGMIVCASRVLVRSDNMSARSEVLTRV